MRNPFSRAGELHGLFEDFRFHRLVSQHSLQLTDLLERIAQPARAGKSLVSITHRYTNRANPIQERNLNLELRLLRQGQPATPVVRGRRGLRQGGCESGDWKKGAKGLALASQLENTQHVGAIHDMLASTRLEFSKEVFQVPFHGFSSDIQRLGNLLVRQVASEQLQDCSLLGCEQAAG